jgi:hypothetical protein
MLKYILFALNLCITTPSFCASKLVASISLSNDYANNSFQKNRYFAIYKNTLIANKIIIKKLFPLFDVGSIISILLASLGKPHRDEFRSIILLILGICLGTIGLIVGEFWLWSVLGLSFLPIVLLIGFTIDYFERKKRRI